MKKYVLTLTAMLFVFTQVVMAQTGGLPINDKTNKVTFMDVVDASGMTAREILEVIEIWGDDKDFELVEKNTTDNKIEFKGFVKINYSNIKTGKTIPGKVMFKVHVSCKEGKYRYVFVDFVHDGSEGLGGELENPKPNCEMAPRSWLVIKQKTKGLLDELVISIEQKILEIQNDPTKSDDW